MMAVPRGFRYRAFAARLGRRARAMLPGQRTTYVSERVDEYRGYWSDAAETLGASFEDVLPGIWAVSRGQQRALLANYVTQCDDPVVLRLAGDKAYSYRLAKEAGVPFPEHVLFDLTRFDEASSFLERVGGPLVVKPANGTSSGLGVSTSVRTGRELRAAAALASLYDSRVLAERMVAGESYRILYLEGCAIHAVRRRGIRLRGDGCSISELLRNSGQAALATDPLVAETLAAQGLTLTSPSAVDEEILIRGLPLASRRQELRTVYDDSVLDRCCPELLRECGAIVRALGSELAGVDIVTTNPSVPLRKAGGAFIEINTTPGIHHHYVAGEREDATPVGVLVLEYLLTRSSAC